MGPIQWALVQLVHLYCLGILHKAPRLGWCFGDSGHGLNGRNPVRWQAAGPQLARDAAVLGRMGGHARAGGEVQGEEDQQQLLPPVPNT